MSLFGPHKHRWVRTTNAQKVHLTEAPGPHADFCFFLEQCRCGAARTIELHPGKQPVIREAIVVYCAPGTGGPG